MHPYKVVIAFVLLGLVVAEKKIELQDIEEDNLRNEKNYVKPEVRSQPNSQSAPGVPLEHLKNSLLQYYEAPTPPPQQTVYIQQYAVTEQPERPVIAPKPEYGPPASASQQTMLGYLSNMPVQFYLVPQYYNQATDHEANTQSGLQIPVPTVSQYQEPDQGLQQAQQQVHQQIHQQVQQQVHPQVHQQTQQYTESNTLNEVQENEIDNHKQHLNHQEVQSSKHSGSGYPRYYNSRIPIREEYRPHPVHLPHPSPLLLKAPPTHLSHIPKTLPLHRPITKPVYTNGGIISNSYTPRPHDTYSIPFKRRPTSLLDSYIPSSLQIEYLKRGLASDPLSAYEALASGKHLSQSQFIPRRYERGFLPNQMYHTAAGGITFGHQKRAPKGEKVNHK